MFAKAAQTSMSLGWQMQTHDSFGRARAMNTKTDQTPMSLGLQMQTNDHHDHQNDPFGKPWRQNNLKRCVSGLATYRPGSWKYLKLKKSGPM